VNSTWLWIAGDCHPRDTGRAILSEIRVVQRTLRLVAAAQLTGTQPLHGPGPPFADISAQLAAAQSSWRRSPRAGTCRRVNDSLSASTVNEQLPTETAGARLSGLLH
jgi:hypothetical protein